MIQDRHNTVGFTWISSAAPFIQHFSDPDVVRSGLFRSYLARMWSTVTDAI